MNRARQVWVACAAVVVVAGCGSDTSGEDSTRDYRDPRPESIAHIREIHYFQSLGELVATSDLVVTATVIAVKPGRWLGEPGAEDSTQMRAVSLDVLQVHWGDVPRSDEIVLEEAGWTSDGLGFQYPGLPWLTSGQTGVFALARSEGGDWVLVNTQARFLFSGGRVQASGEAGNALHHTFNDVSRAEMTDRLDQAVAAARSGTAKPDSGIKGEKE